MFALADCWRITFRPCHEKGPDVQIWTTHLEGILGESGGGRFPDLAPGHMHGVYQKLLHSLAQSECSWVSPAMTEACGASLNRVIFSLTGKFFGPSPWGEINPSLNP